MVNSPCLDCPDRTPGCHKPEACSAWAEFQKALTAEKNMIDEAQKPLKAFDEYQIARRKRHHIRSGSYRNQPESRALLVLERLAFLK